MNRILETDPLTSSAEGNAQPASPPTEIDLSLQVDLDLDEAPPVVARSSGSASAFEQAPAMAEAGPPGAETEARGLIADFEREAKARGKEASAAALFHQMGRLWELRLKSPRNAAACYQSAFNIDPGYRPNLTSARRLFGQVGNYQMVEQLLDAELRAVAPPIEPRDGEIPQPGATLSNPEVRNLLLEKAALLAERLGRPQEAAQLLEQLQLADPRDPTPAAALEGLDGPDLPEQNPAALALLLTQLADAVEDAPLKVYYLTTAAALHEERLKSPDEAAALYRRALALSPRDQAALSGVKAHAERQGHLDELLQALYSEAKTERGATAAAILYQAARLCSERLGRDGDALEALVAARRHSPQDPLVLGELARLYEQASRFTELAEVLSARALGCRNPQESIEVQLALGALYEDRLAREVDAIGCYRAVLATSPTHTAALASLGKLYARRGMWAELLWTYEQETAAATDGRTRVIKLYKSAEVLEQRLGRTEDSIVRYNEILTQQPGYLPAQKALTRLYEKADRIAELCELLEKEVALTHDRDQRISLRTQIALLYEERLKDPDRAIQILKAVIEEAPDHLPTIRALARLCERAQHWKEVLWANELESGLAGDQKQIISLLHRNGEILEEQLGDKDGAVEAYQKALALSPTYLPALKALGKLYAQKGRWEELVTMYRQEAEVAQNPEDAAGLTLKIGQLFEDKLFQEEQAISAYREVLGLSPGHLPALAALQRIYRNQRNWEGLVATLRAEAEARADPTDRAPVLFSLGELAEQRLERADLAADAYQEVLRLVPDHALALRALDRLYAAASCWRELGQVYERQLATSPVGPARAAPYLKLARLYSERLADLPKAAQCFEAALASAPDPELSLVCLKGLERLRGSLADRGRRADIRGRLAARVTDKRMASQLELSAGIDRERAGQAPGIEANAAQSATQDFERALALWPDNQRAAMALEIALRKVGDFARLADLLALRLERVTAGTSRAEVALELAEICVAELKDHARGLKALQVGLVNAPQSLPLLRLSRTVNAALGQFEAAHDAALSEAAAARDPQLAVDALLYAGDLAERQHHLDQAVADYRRILDRDPVQREAAQKLGLLLTESGDAGSLLEIQDRQAQALVATQDPNAPDALVAVSERLATLGNDPKRALDRLDQAVALDPEHAAAVFARGEILLRLGRPAEAAEAYRRTAELSKAPAALADAHFRLGVILQDQLRDPVKAAAHFQAAVSAAPTHAAALERLALAHEANGNWTGADYALGLLERCAPDMATLARALLTRARVLLDGLGDGQAALARVQQAHGLLPDDPQTLSLMCQLEQRLRDWEGAAKTCERLANLTEATDAASSRAFRMRAGEIYSQNLRRSEEAVQSYRRALDLDPSDEAARIALADLYAADPGHLNDAIAEHRWLLRGDPARAASYRALFRIFSVQQQHDRAYCAAAVLSFLQSGDEEALNVHAELRRRLPPEAAVGINDDQRQRWVTHPDGRGPLGPVLALLGEHLEKIAPWPAESFPLVRGDRYKADHPLRHLATSLAAQLGQPEFEMYQGKANELLALPVSPPALLVGPLLVRRVQSREQRFLLARLLARVREGSQVAAFVPPEWICDLLGAAQKLAVPTARPTLGRPGPALDEIERRLQKQLPRKARKAIEELLRTPLRVPPDGGLSWARSLLLTADRAALLLGVDVASGLSATLATESGTPESLALLVRERNDLAELCRFAVSEDFFQLRAALRLNVSVS